MNREEAIRKLEHSKKAYQMLIDEKVDSGKLVGKDVKGEWKADTPLDEAYKSMIDALDMAIKALEQEPCEDAISRQAVLEIVSDMYDLARADVLSDAINQIKNLPSVNPQTRIGHWIKKEDDTCWWYVCSECEQEPLKNRWNDDDVLSEYCPNCGAKMVEPQEREE